MSCICDNMPFKRNIKSKNNENKIYENKIKKKIKFVTRSKHNRYLRDQVKEICQVNRACKNKIERK
jgi:hypothetical protein